MSNPYLTKDLFAFQRELKQNNNREWFEENKWRYERHLKEPLLDLIADFAPLLAQISPHYLAIPKTVGGSLFRIYRDIRFSNNKTPYKTAAGVHFRHNLGKDVHSHSPGYYLHIEPGNVFLALGIWHPDSATLRAIRSRMIEQQDLWEDVRDHPDFTKRFLLQGTSLKRAPKGVDPEHPLIEDLKRKDFIAVSPASEDDALRPDLLPWMASVWEQGTPLMRFLTGALEQPF
ncbi:MAG TPA: TIGR02453 family protein [Bacteroidetes bacterium]|nr:TIGR02453 family protein [Bacteroidota bacterium]